MNEISAECIRLGALVHTHTHTHEYHSLPHVNRMCLVRHLQNVHMEFHVGQNATCNMQTKIPLAVCSFFPLLVSAFSVSVFLLIEFSFRTHIKHVTTFFFF